MGFGTSEGAEAFRRSAGVGGAVAGHEEVAKAIISDINARGGVAGRKIVPAFYDFPTSGEPNAQAQAACVRWTEDRPVFAVVNGMAGVVADETLTACLAQRQTPLLQIGPVIRPRSVYSRYAPYLYAPAEPTLERLVPVWMQLAAANGYFDGWDTIAGRPGSAQTKIGILSFRPAYGSDFTRVVRQELGRRSQRVAATFEFSGDAARVGDEMNQAVLRFREAEVTHVISSSSILLFFTPAAEAQRYRPRYAVTSDNAPRAVQTMAPEGQMAGALGVGFLPTRDVDNARDPGDVSAATTRCRRIMQKAGQDTSSRTAFHLMAKSCDAFNLLAAAIEKGGLSPAGMHRGVQAVGSIPSASTFRMLFPGGRFDGASAVRDLAYRNNCSCFAYMSRKNHGM